MVLKLWRNLAFKPVVVWEDCLAVSLFKLQPHLVHLLNNAFTAFKSLDVKTCCSDTLLDWNPIDLLIEHVWCFFHWSGSKCSKVQVALALIVVILLRGHPPDYVAANYFKEWAELNAVIEKKKLDSPEESHYKKYSLAKYSPWIFDYKEEILLFDKNSLVKKLKDNLVICHLVRNYNLFCFASSVRVLNLQRGGCERKLWLSILLLIPVNCSRIFVHGNLEYVHLKDQLSSQRNSHELCTIQLENLL